MHLLRSRFGWSSPCLVLAAVVTTGCLQDFEQFRPGNGGAGGEGTGGEGGGDPCANVVCDDDNPCTDDVCDVDGKCLFPTAEVFTIPQVAGDCKEATCEGKEVVTVTASDDVPLDDGNQCTDEVCVGEMPDHPNVVEGTQCNDTGVCTAAGVCSDCLDESMCGTDTDCADYSCNDDNECVVVFEPGLISGGDDGDCEALQCVGRNPDPVVAPYDDPEDDGNECTEDTCDGSDRLHTPVAAGTACDDSLFCTVTDACDAAGTCVGTGDPCMGGTECANSCNEATNDCFDLAGTACGSSTDNSCTDPDTCDGAGACLTHHAADMTPCGSSSNTSCTDPDRCNDGVCDARHEVPGTACDDSMFCNGPDTCNASGMCTSAGDPCSGAAPTCCTDHCADTDTSETDCGDCGLACATGATACAGGTCECTAGSCECDGGEDCPGAQTCTDGSCG